MEARMCPRCRENVADDQIECPFCDEPTVLHSDRETWREHAANTGVRQRADGAYFGEPEWCEHGRNKLADCGECTPINPLPAALVEIIENAPTKEPRDGPTVGFQPSRDPEQDDGNDTVEEAFQEGVARGLWEAAEIARAALAASPTPEPKS